MAAIATPLAQAGVPIFVVSTFDTDYVLVQGEKLDRAIEALREAGHSVERVVLRPRDERSHPAAG